jgi:hypothetical protein
MVPIDAKQLQAALGRRLAEIEDEAAAIAALPPYWEVPAAPAKETHRG